MGKKTILSFLSICTVILLLGCRSSSIQKNTGSLEFKIRANEGIFLIQNIVPNVEMKCYYYRIIGKGPNGATLEKQIDDAYYRIDNLVAGEWTITVDGYNGQGIHIVTDTRNCTIFKNKINTVFFTLRPLDGEGMLFLELI